jgi:exosortase
VSPEANMSIEGTINRAKVARANGTFLGFMVLSIIVCWNGLKALTVFSLRYESSSHVLLIPLISIYFLYTERESILRVIRPLLAPGGTVVAIAVIFYFLTFRYRFTNDPEKFLPGATLAIVMLWWGGFLLCYGTAAWRRASFSLLFLLLMIPLPAAMLDSTIYYLQSGSTEIAYLLFKAVGVPVLREGFILHVPHQSIEVAQECSGIRSSVALFITCLLAAHLFLRTKWKMLVFVLLALPLAIIKNGIRITTLTLLAVYVDPSFLTGSLHHEGGFVFFFLGLAILFPVLLLLQKSERDPAKLDSVLPPTEPGFARES